MRALVIPKQVLTSLFIRVPRIQMTLVLNIARNLSLRLREADERIAKLVHERNEEMIGLVHPRLRSATVRAANDPVLFRLRLEIPESCCSESGQAESVLLHNSARRSNNLVAKLAYY